MTGPQETPKQKIYALAAINAESAAEPVSSSLPFPSQAEEPKMQARAPRVNVIPTEPKIRSGLRPNLSTSAIATKVEPMLTAPLITF